MPTTEKNYLFVCGIQRSGTTALANLVNWHSEVCVCIERFRNLMRNNKIEQFTPDRFELDKLLDFSDDATNLTPEKSERFHGFYESVRANYEQLKFVGDKVPNNHRFIESIHKKFERAKFLFIVRDIHDTACSWQARAEREGDGWPETKTAEKAVAPWNDCNRVFLKMKLAYPDACHVVGYEQFFDGDADDLSPVDQLTDFLKLNAEERLYSAFTNARKIYSTNIKTKSRTLDPDVYDGIEKAADLDVYKQLLALQSNVGSDAENDLRAA